jgi:hypothetical protein
VTYPEADASMSILNIRIPDDMFGPEDAAWLADDEADE